MPLSRRLIPPGLAACALTLAGCGADVVTGGSSWDVDAGPVFELEFQLTEGRRVLFETRELSEDSDPVLHLLGPGFETSGEVEEVAFDDNSGPGKAARFWYTPVKSGPHLLIMRARGNDSGGTAHVFMDEKLVWPNLPFGGHFQVHMNLRKKEQISTVLLPRGPIAHRVYFLDEDGSMLERNVVETLKGFERELPEAWPDRTVMVGVHWLDLPGPLRIVRNDYRLSDHDPDKDRLGTELEEHIGTCSSLSGIAGNWECDRATDARDTDGDAISDRLELMGYTRDSPYQLLPRWGANPRHKDIFIELDFMIREEGEFDGVMPAHVAREVAEIYGDKETSPIFRLANAQTLRNPDLEPGIRMHFDTGQDPLYTADDSDFTLFGDWGGHNAVPAKCDDDGECEGRRARDVWKAQLQENRRGIFHYALTYGTGGGSTPLLKVFSSFNHNSTGNTAHEFGHSLGLGHSGPMDHETVDANCKPNYPSLMSYAYLNSGHLQFSDGYGRPALNNTGLQEIGALSNPSALHSERYMDDLEQIFDYTVNRAAGMVDWNRDGAFAAPPVRAYANNNGSGCELTRYNKIKLGIESMRSPALTRVKNRTLMFHLDNANVLGFHITLDPLTCPVPAPEGCGPPPLRRFIDETWNGGTITAFDAHPIMERREEKVLLVFLDDAGRLWETVFSTGSFEFSSRKRITTGTTPQGEISLAGDGGTTYLAFAGGDRRMRLKRRNSESGQWTSDQLATDGLGNPLTTLASDTSPSVLHVSLASGDRLYALVPAAATLMTAAGLLQLYELDFVNGTWSRSPWLGDDSGGTSGKPAMAWLPVTPGSVMEGRLHLMWLRRDDADDETVIRERILVTKPPGTVNDIEFGFVGDHDNVWLYGYGMDLLYEEGVDANLRALVSVKVFGDSGSEPAAMQFRTKADGVIDYTLRNWNDWASLGAGACITLAASSAQDNPIKCPDWSF